MNFNQIYSSVSNAFPDELKDILSVLPSNLHTSIELLSMLKFILVYGSCILVIGILSRLLLGKRSHVNQALSASIGILLIYVVSIAIYTFRPWQLEHLLSPLPFANFMGDYLFIVPFHGSSFDTICSNILSMIILSFLVNLADSVLPDIEGILPWYLCQFLMVLLSMAMHLGANYLINSYIPVFIVTYAPSILLVLLLCFMLLGAFKIILGIVLAVVNPIIGAAYAFFFSSHIGKQLTKAVLSTAVLCIVFYLFDTFGYSIIAITPAALLTYVPLLVTLLILWYLIGHEI